MIKTVLTVDIGTTSLKAGLISADGEVVSFFRKEFDLSDKHTVARQWMPVFLEAWEKLSPAAHVSAIAISGNGPTIVSRDGTTLLWNENVSEKILSSFQQNKSSSLFIPRIQAFRQMFPSSYENSPQLFSGPEYLIFCLTGQMVTILPEARFEPAYWNNTMLEEYGIEASKLPPFVFPAANCGLWQGIPVFAGGPDFIVALIGTNTLQPGKLCDRSGSSEGFNFCVKEPIVAEGVRTLPSVIKGLWNISVLIPESGSLAADVRVEKIIEAVEKLRQIAHENKIPFPSEMTVTGGQANDIQLMKNKSEHLGLNIRTCRIADAELLGDACAAFVGLGEFKNLTEAAEKLNGNL